MEGIQVAEKKKRICRDFRRLMLQIYYKNISILNVEKSSRVIF